MLGSLCVNIQVVMKLFSPGLAHLSRFEQTWIFQYTFIDRLMRVQNKKKY